MNFAEADHIRQLRDTLERFVEKEMPRTAAASWDKSNHFPREVFHKLASLGVLGHGGEEGWNTGWQMIVGAGLDVEKLEVAAIAVGIARAALDDAWAYAFEREQFGKTISHYQSIQHKLSEMKTQLQAARLMLYQAAWMANEHQRCGVEISMAKLFTTEAAKAIALESQTILGAYGYVKDFDVERYVRDALLLTIIGGSSAVQRNNIFKWSGKKA